MAKVSDDGRDRADQAGRLLLDAIKWQKGKENGRVFGDRQVLAGDPEAPVQVEHSGTVALAPSDAYLKLLNGG
jgi:hypothetical protein